MNIILIKHLLDYTIVSHVLPGVIVLTTDEKVGSGWMVHSMSTTNTTTGGMCLHRSLSLMSIVPECIYVFLKEDG